MTKPHKTTVTIEGQKAKRFCHKPPFPPDIHRAESITVIAFDNAGQILGVKRGRTFDIITCLQEWDDDSVQDAARREAREQAGVILGDVALVAVIETQLVETEASRSFTPLVTGIVKEIDGDFPLLAKKRLFLDKETFLKRYRFGDPEDMRVLIEMAEAAHRKMKKAKK